MLKEGKALEKQLRRLYHLLKIVDPKDNDIQNFWDDSSFMKKLKTICGKFQKPVELLAARTLGHVSRMICFNRDSSSDEMSVDDENLPEQEMHLVKSIPCFFMDDKSYTAEDELAHLGECDDEDICLFTTAIFRRFTINCESTPFFGSEDPDIIGKWLHGLLSNAIHSVVLDSLDMLSDYFNSKIILDCGKDANANSLLAIDSFISAPNPSGFLQHSQAQLNIYPSGWMPPVYSKGPVCSIALRAFQCLCRATSEQHGAFVQLLTSQKRIVKKVKSYLFGSWTEENWKALFPGSKFCDDNDDKPNAFSSGRANFQRMEDGLFCEEESIKEMILRFREVSMKCFRMWLSIPILKGITKFIKRDLIERIAFLLCETASDMLRGEAAKALLNVWAALSSNAHIISHLKRIYVYDFKRYSCISQPLRGRLNAMLVEVLEEEDVMDVL
ncbi:uncharacterized protein MONOS_5557 [Monocercomonoides exilis]|uniref:uncharacterized protein n=1 Tax=Monocercomonoides exilis TaxID=2049356 RepID=UPI00355996A9|nr:hypothetical protein MONOS_5557 [Monocercomonoides exilis]|eukprot:MONOS_5557.1-p1 / transcript=MONOS_5557.1 / gene=MONOS_5557 / organism=Monocercomonoides_exilis_PA203 / gene_product=unspecified product / transcript_product=unspecified product / location=Mono_scaffold00163:44726-46134(-) / protein_length=443 / sequence_SO=supercontig / SO=protein_coding / is_pseudo=false